MNLKTQVMFTTHTMRSKIHNVFSLNYLVLQTHKDRFLVSEDSTI